MGRHRRHSSASGRKHALSEELSDRLAALGAGVLDLVQQLPDGSADTVLTNQLVRAAMAPGAHFAEARSAQSRDDFIHKAALAAKEAREAVHWLRVSAKARCVDADVDDLTEEARELAAMLFASVQTAREGREDQPSSEGG